MARKSKQVGELVDRESMGFFSTLWYFWGLMVLYGTFFPAGLFSQLKVTYGLFPSEPSCGILLNNYEILWGGNVSHRKMGV